MSSESGLSAPELQERMLERCPHGTYAYRRYLPERMFVYAPCDLCRQRAYEHMMQRCIELWHESEGSGHLHDALGISQEEYGKWLERGSGYVVVVDD